MAGRHGGTLALAREIYGVIFRYWGSLLGIEREDLTGQDRLQDLGLSFVSLPFQFLPFLVAAAKKSSESRRIERLTRRWLDYAEAESPRETALVLEVVLAMSGTERRVAITGIGMIRSLGTTREQVWDGLVEGRCGIGPLSLFDSEGYRSRLVAEYPRLRGFPPLHRAREAPALAQRSGGDCRRRRSSRRLGAFSKAPSIALASVSSSDLETGDMLRNEMYFADVLTRGIDRARPSQAFNHFTSTSADAVAQRHGLEGMKACLLSACSSTTAAIGYAADTILGGRHEAVLCGEATCSAGSQ